jgi:hypothetical protein
MMKIKKFAEQREIDAFEVITGLGTS